MHCRVAKKKLQAKHQSKALTLNNKNLNKSWFMVKFDCDIRNHEV